ncbi:UNVERIFIED_CONTAM: hypothetical protein FKN15_036140 [Acipenser sinensis]
MYKSRDSKLVGFLINWNNAPLNKVVQPIRGIENRDHLKRVSVHGTPAYRSWNYARRKIVTSACFITQSNFVLGNGRTHTHTMNYYCFSNIALLCICFCPSCSVKKELGERQVEIENLIEERLKGLERLNQAVESLKLSAHKERAESEQVLSELIRSIERIRTEVGELIGAKEKAAVSRADEQREQLEQEIQELRKRKAEMEQLSETEDHIHFLQVRPRFNADALNGGSVSGLLNTLLFVFTMGVYLAQSTVNACVQFGLWSFCKILGSP